MRHASVGCAHKPPVLTVAFARTDLSAKANAQEVVAGMLGMGAGIALSTAIGDVLLYAYCAYAGAAQR